MLLVKNYNDLEKDEKVKIVDDLFTTSCYILQGDKNKVFEKFEESRKGSLPQYLFLYEDQKMTGYAIIMGSVSTDPEIQFWCISNYDELPKEQAVFLLDAMIQVCRDCHDQKLSDAMMKDERSIKIGKF